MERARVVQTINYDIDQLKQYAVQVANAKGIPPHYLLGLIEHESHWNPLAKNPGSSARGLGQHLDKTLINMGLSPTNDRNDPRHNPYLSIELTAEHLIEKRARSPDWQTAVRFYGENTPQYLRKVMATVNRYQGNTPERLDPDLDQEDKRLPEYLGPILPSEYRHKRLPEYLGPTLPEETVGAVGDPALAFEMLGDMPNVGKAAGRIVTGVVSGALSTAEGIAGFLDYLSGGRVGGKISKQIGDFIRKAPIKPEDRRFADHLLSAAGSMATFLIPGIGVARGVKALDSLAKMPHLANFLGIGTMSLLEAATEAGSVFESAKAQGKKKSDAEWAAAKTFWTNVPLLAITNKLGYFTEGRGLLRRVGLGGITEGTQEATQEIISGHALGGWANIRPKDVLTAGAVGAIIGGGVGGMGGITGTAVLPQPPVPAPAPIPPAPPAPAVPPAAPMLEEPAVEFPIEAPPTEIPPPIPKKPSLKVVEPLSPEAIEKNAIDGERTYEHLLRAIENEDWIAVQENVEGAHRILSSPVFDEMLHPENIGESLRGDPFLLGEGIPKLIKTYREKILDPFRKRYKLLTLPPTGKEELSFREVLKTKKARTFKPLVELPAGVEERFQAARSVRTDVKSFLGRLKEYGREAILEPLRKSYREYAALPETPRFANLRSDLRRLKAAREFASTKAIGDISSLIEPLEPPDFDLYTKDIIVRDFNYMHSQQGVEKLPYGFLPEELDESLSRIDKKLEEFPAVKEKLKERKRIWDSLRTRYVLAARNAGLNVEDKFKNPDYFRHIVLDVAQEQGQPFIAGPGKRWGGAIRGRSYLKRRVAHTKDISSRYIDAEYEAMSQMLMDMATLETLNKVRENYDKTIEYKSRAAARGESNWKTEIEPGYEEWYPDPSSTFYHVYTVPERAVVEAIKQQKGEILPLEIGSAIALGRQRTPMVIPSEVAQTLNTAFYRPPERTVANLGRAITRRWKAWTLMNPVRLMGYNMRNLMGDLNALVAVEPRAMKYIPEAAWDLKNWNRKKPMSSDIEKALEWGIVDSTFTTEELETMGEEKIVTDLIETKFDLLTKPGKLSKRIRKLIGMPRKGTIFRENILRLAAFKHVQNEWAQGNKILGFARRREVEGITDPEAQMAYVARHMLGDYASLSEVGTSLRRFWLPFWSFQEINLGRWFRGLQNATRGGRLGPTTEWKLWKAPIITAASVTPYFMQALAMGALATAWNLWNFPEEEEALPEYQKHQPHVIVGRNDDGSVRIFRGSDSAREFLAWFGADEWVPLAQRVWQGQLPLKEALNKAAWATPEAILRKGYGMLTPFKSGVEIMAGIKLFPDPTNPRYTQNRMEETAHIIGLKEEYNALWGKQAGPSWGRKRDWRSLFALTQIDIEKTSYYDIQNLKNEFRERYLGKPPVTARRLTPTGKAYRNVIESTIYDDREAFLQALQELAELDKDVGDLERAMEHREPLRGLNDKEKIKFILWLTPAQRTKLQTAYKWYGRMDIGKQIKREMQRKQQRQK